MMTMTRSALFYRQRKNIFPFNMPLVVFPTNSLFPNINYIYPKKVSWRKKLKNLWNSLFVGFWRAKFTPSPSFARQNEKIKLSFIYKSDPALRYQRKKRT